jgi:hypothetical protein
LGVLGASLGRPRVYGARRPWASVWGVCAVVLEDVNAVGVGVRGPFARLPVVRGPCPFARGPWRWGVRPFARGPWSLRMARRPWALGVGRWSVARWGVSATRRPRARGGR